MEPFLNFQDMQNNFYDNQKYLITTERLFLRPFTTSDVPTVAQICNNYNLVKSTLLLPYPYTKADAMSWISTHYEGVKNYVNVSLAIVKKETNTLIGSISLSIKQQHNHAEMGYWIAEEEWGKGYGTEAAKALLNYAFNELHLHRVHAKFFTTNPASGKIMQKCGMQHEGTLASHLKRFDEWKDVALYGILNPNETK